jgi:hypothetical protein
MDERGGRPVSIFAKQQPPIPEGRKMEVKSRFHELLDDIDAAQKKFEHAQTVLSSIMLDLQKGVNFADRIRNDLSKAIEDHGGLPAVLEADIESTVVNQYAPKRVSHDEHQH